MNSQYLTTHLITTAEIINISSRLNNNRLSYQQIEEQN